MLTYNHENFIDIEFLPTEISGTKLYEPGNNPTEKKSAEQLKIKWGKYNY